ncbi:MAG: hemerythrin domain-containing protein [Acidobacteriaceae bacterium]|nr:hemerythrin domain-containing protein [Acidobacteriaceae bacterium]
MAKSELELQPVPEHAGLPRRRFVATLTSAVALALPIGSLGCREKEEENVSTNEDLMREHGILKRVLLAYEEIVRRIHSNQEFPPQAAIDGATIIRKFVEDYHEKLEEDHLFPRFRKAGKQTDLINTLYNQHQAGRRITDRILATAASLKTPEDHSLLANDLVAFNRMYAPHEAREDTILFPELHKIILPHEYDSLGEQFEKIERQTFGGDGFDIYVDKVAALEKELGIYDLEQFTPH